MERKLFYIKHRGKYYGPNWSGNVKTKTEAGTYYEEEAFNELATNSEIYLEEVIPYEHNEAIDEKIAYLKSLKIK